MSSDKILIELVCAGIGQSYDAIVPRTITVGSLCDSLFGILEESAGIRYGNYQEVMVMSARTGQALVAGFTLDESGVDSGDTLYIL